MPAIATADAIAWSVRLFVCHTRACRANDVGRNGMLFVWYMDVLELSAVLRSQ